MSNVEVDHETGAVHFSSEEEGPVAEVRKCLTQIGYPPVDVKNTLVRKAKSYVSCATGKMAG